MLGGAIGIGSRIVEQTKYLRARWFFGFRNACLGQTDERIADTGHAGRGRGRAA